MWIVGCSPFTEFSKRVNARIFVFNTHDENRHIHDNDTNMFFSSPTNPSICAPWLIGAIAFLAVAMSHMERSSGDGLSLVSHSSPSTSSSLGSSSSHTDALVEWFRGNGGYLHERVEIRRQDQDDSTSPYGVFAKSDIEKGEIVMKIPSSLYFQLDVKDITPEVKFSPKDTLEVQLEQEKKAMEAYYSNTCKLAHKLRNEMELYQRHPSSSKFAAYMRYLNETQPRGQIPATYSPLAKEILREVQGRKSAEGMTDGPSWYSGDAQFPPLVDWIDEFFVRKGCIDADDADGYHAVALTIQRGYDNELIPIWDMVNHDNRRLNVASNSIHDEEGLKVWTLDVIGKGEELFASYNFCFDCLEDGSGDDWGIHGIFRDFGFVEGYPQYWPFLDQRVFALIEEEPRQDGGQLTYHAQFYNDGVSTGDEAVAYGPSTDAVRFFETQLDRLGNLNVEEQVMRLTAEHERSMILRYYKSLMNALETMIISSLRREDDMSGEGKIQTSIIIKSEEY